MKRLLALLLAVLLPLTALAEIEYDRAEKKFITFPGMDEWRGHFSSVKKWTIVTPENMDENWELVSARGDTEEEIRARYAGENFLFEAYSPDLPADACFRAEMYEDDVSRDVWHLRHLDAAERKKLNAYLGSGRVFKDRDVYNLFNTGSSDGCHLMAYFTNYPPATHESGRMRIDFRNGRMYVFSYCVSGRLAGAARWYTAKEKEQLNKTPITSMDTKFLSKSLPALPAYELKNAFPQDVAPGDVTIKGTVEKGSTVSASLNGKALAAKMDKKNNFTVVLPLNEIGEQEVVITVSTPKFTTRTMTYTVNVSDTVTPLTLHERPAEIDAVGDAVLSGVTAPGAQITITLDESEPILITADDEGAFTHTIKVESRGEHTLTLSAQAEGKEANAREIVFKAEYEDVNDGIKAFSEDLTDAKFADICANVEEHIGDKVKISVLTKEITINEQGLGLLCTYNASSGKEKDKTPLYVTVPGYAQCQIGERMIITIYGTVAGTRVLFGDEGEEEERVEIVVEYGTYLVSR